MLPRLIIVIATLATIASQAATPLPTARSVSGQFLVVDARQSARSSPSPAALATDTNLITLDAAALAITAERHRQELSRDLRAGDSWRGRIKLIIQPAQTATDEITIVSQRFRSGWSYEVLLPDHISRERLSRGLVRVLLQELANRNASDRAAEIPAWLIEGFASKLAGAQGGSLLIAAPTVGPGSGGLRIDALDQNRSDAERTRENRRLLREQTPLTVEQLSWPAADEVEGDRYQLNAELFLTELLNLKDGPASLRETIAGLGQCYNWQTAFFKSFEPHFARQLDLEKWWALRCANFVGQDIGHLWTREQSAEKLNQVLRASVSVQKDEKDKPAYTSVTLQSVIREWDAARQTKLLQQKSRELNVARLQVHPEFSAWVDEYRAALDAYLTHRKRASLNISDMRNPRRQSSPLAEETCARLDALDAQLAAIIGKSITPPASENSAKPARLTADDPTL